LSTLKYLNNQSFKNWIERSIIMDKKTVKVDKSTINLREEKNRRTRVKTLPIILKDTDVAKFKTLAKIVPTEEKFLPITPYAKNAAVQSGEFDAEAQFPIDAPVMKWEEDIINEMRSILEKHYPNIYLDGKVKDYLKADESEYAGIDAWRNLLKMGREVTPGAKERLEENFNGYFKDEYTFKVDEKLFNKAIRMVIEEIGENKVAYMDTWLHGKVPYENYHTNMGYSTFHRDDADYQGRPAYEVALERSKKLELKDIQNLPAVKFSRSQRSGFEYKEASGKFVITKFKDSKARPVWGASREGNLHGAKDVIPLTEYCKNNVKLFAGYKDNPGLLAEMDKTERLAKKLGWKLFNGDRSAYDQSLSAQLLRAGGEVAKAAIIQQEGKRLYDAMVDWAIGMPLLSWESNLETGDKIPSGTRFKHAGSLPSGIIITNFHGGICNAIGAVYVLLEIYPDFSKVVSEFRSKGVAWMYVMGDDNLTIYRDLDDLEEFDKRSTDELGLVTNPAKGEAGAFFLQKRLLRDSKTNEAYFVSPSPRVVSKIFWVERAKGLGPYAWTFATWMKLEAIKNNPEFSDVVKMVARYDEMKLGVNETPEQLVSNLTKESTLENRTPIERLYDGDPNKSHMWDKDNVASEWVREMHHLIKEALNK
jgi:hypothetical protein